MANKTTSKASNSKPTTRSATEPAIDNAKFVEIWQKSNTPEEVAKALGLSDKGYATRKAIAMRKHGVPLRKMSRGRGKSDYSELIKLAQKFAPQAANAS
jgi:hypothetical protein